MNRRISGNHHAALLLEAVVLLVLDSRTTAASSASSASSTSTPFMALANCVGAALHSHTRAATRRIVPIHPADPGATQEPKRGTPTAARPAACTCPKSPKARLWPDPTSGCRPRSLPRRRQDHQVRGSKGRALTPQRRRIHSEGQPRPCQPNRGRSKVVRLESLLAANYLLERGARLGLHRVNPHFGVDRHALSLSTWPPRCVPVAVLDPRTLTAWTMLSLRL